MPKKRKPNISYGWKDRKNAKNTPPVECSVCGQPMKPGVDDSVEVCKGCSGVKRNRFLPDKSESVDRDTDDDDDERDEFRDAYFAMREEWGAE